jgi:hypothetical protein
MKHRLAYQHCIVMGLYQAHHAGQGPLAGPQHQPGSVALWQFVLQYKVCFSLLLPDAAYDTAL